MSGVKSGVVSTMSVSAARMRWTKLVVSGLLNVSAGASVLVRVNRERTQMRSSIDGCGVYDVHESVCAVNPVFVVILFFRGVIGG
jgi:ABC-type uncharacterized transport system permease subunit